MLLVNHIDLCHLCTVKGPLAVHWDLVTCLQVALVVPTEKGQSFQSVIITRRKHKLNIQQMITGGKQKLNIQH